MLAQFPEDLASTHESQGTVPREMTSANVLEKALQVFGGHSGGGSGGAGVCVCVFY